MGLMAWLFGESISGEDLHRRMTAGEKFLVLDVRSEEEYHGPDGRIPGARLVPLRQVSARAGDEVTGFTGTVITVCSHGLRSMAAQRALRKLGVSSFSLRGGMKAWTARGFEVVRDVKATACAAASARPC